MPLAGKFSRMAPDGWETFAAQHTVWGRVTDGASHRDRAVTLVRQLAEARARSAALLTDDPWQDGDFARRMSEQVASLIGFLPDDVRFSGPEAALLVTTPFLHAARSPRSGRAGGRPPPSWAGGCCTGGSAGGRRRTSRPRSRR